MRALARPVTRLLLPVLVGVLGVGSLAAAHPGGLDASGCHTNRKTGDYHCHRRWNPPTSGASSNGPSAASSDVVKKSRTGICYVTGTTDYAQTQPFTAYKSLESCLSSGGRLPKG